MDRRLLLKFLALSPLFASPLISEGAGAEVPRPRRRPQITSGDNEPLPVLVIDAGHGGRDPGAIGISGTYEKNVVLDIASRLAADLEPVAKVRLTRSDDRFLALPERVQIAREAQASLFLSIHADSAPDNENARGLSAYILSDTASDSFAEKLATGENIVDERYGASVSANAAIADILYDLTARQTVGAARLAREAIVSGAGRDLKLLDSPKRAANFAVLRAPDVPSLLIETGFLSNPDDESLLKSATQRNRIAAVLAREIKSVLHHSLFR